MSRASRRLARSRSAKRGAGRKSARTEPNARHTLRDAVEALSTSPEVHRQFMKDRKFPTRSDAYQDEALSVDEVQSELGSTGVLRGRNGLPAYEYNRELPPVRARGLYAWHGEYHKMINSDPILAGVGGLMVRETTRADYTVMIPPDATEDEQRAGRMVARYFGLDGTPGWMTGGLRRLMFHAFQSVFYGFSALEIVPSVEMFEGRPVVVPGGLHWRAPWSVERWLWQGENLVGLQQAIQDEQARTTPPLPPTGVPSSVVDLNQHRAYAGRTRSTIPINRLLLFVHAGVDGNPEGRSILRPAWRYWQLKVNTLRRIERSEETLWGGTTIIKELTDKDGLPLAAVTGKDLDYICSLVEQRIENWIKWLLSPAGYEIKTDYPDYELEDRSKYLEWIDHQLLMSLAAPLFGLSASHSASKALAGGLGQVFYATVSDLAADILDVINGLPGLPWTGLIPRIVQPNIETNPGFRYPKLVASGIEHQDLKSWTDAVTKLAQFRIITPDAKTEAHARGLAGLPQLTEEQIEKIRQLDAERNTRVDEEGTQAPQASAPAGDM